MNPTRTTLAALALSALVAGCSGTQESESSHHEHASADGASHAHAGEDGDDGEHVDLEQLPTTVRAAAMARMPTLVLVGAEREVEHGVLVYELFGTVDGEPYELEISEFGNVLEVERVGDELDEDHEGADEEDDDGSPGTPGDAEGRALTGG
jgi:hypothetical protein